MHAARTSEPARLKICGIAEVGERTVKRVGRASGLRPGAVEREVDDPELYAVRTLPAVDRQTSRRMQGAATAFKKRLAQRLPGGTKRDGGDRAAIARLQPCADVSLPDLFRVDEKMRGKREDRLRIARTEWVARSEGRACGG